VVEPADAPSRARRRAGKPRPTARPGAGLGGFPGGGVDDAEHAAIRGGERTGRPPGSAAFVAERRLRRTLARRKPGRKAQAATAVACPFLATVETWALDGTDE